MHITQLHGYNREVQVGTMASLAHNQSPSSAMQRID
jgi:hypothetical protein